MWVHIFRIAFPKNTSGRVLLWLSCTMWVFKYIFYCFNLKHFWKPYHFRHYDKKQKQSFIIVLISFLRHGPCSIVCNHDLKKKMEIMGKLLPEYSIMMFNTIKNLIILFITNLFARIGIDPLIFFVQNAIYIYSLAKRAAFYLSDYFSNSCLTLKILSCHLKFLDLPLIKCFIIQYYDHC